MTENEKLRALLAEARAWVVAVQDDSLRERIDAALAEPIGECDLCAVHKAFHDVAVSQRDGNAYLRAEVERERDEARAERNHFKAMLRERADALLAAQEEIERLKLRFEAQWEECHDGSDSACCKAHE